MDQDIKVSCKHRYVVGYSFRMPQPFFRSLPCDGCGCRIRLTWPFRTAYALVNLLGFLLAYVVSTSVQIALFGSTLIVSILLFVLLIQVFQVLNRLILKHGKWVEVKKK